MAELNVGDRVRVLVDSPTGEPVEGTVRVVSDKAGKALGVELDNYVAGGHELDGKTENKVKPDPVTGVTYGTGWYTLTDNVEVLTDETTVS